MGDVDHTRELLERFPELSTEVYQEVLEANNFDTDATFRMLSDMVVDAEQVEEVNKKEEKDGWILVKKRGRRRKDDVDVSGEESASSQEGITESAGEEVFIKESDVSEGDIVDVGLTDSRNSPGMTVENDLSETLKASESFIPLITAGKSARIHTSWGRRSSTLSLAARYKVDELASRYSWANRNTIKEILAAFDEDGERAEVTLLDMFPVDQVEGFTSGEKQRWERERNAEHWSNGKIAEFLRKRDEKDLRDLAKGNTVEERRKKFAMLKSEFARYTTLRHEALKLARYTRKAEHGIEQKRYQTLVDKYSDELIKTALLLPEFQGNKFDLHGFTKTQAVRLLNVKLDEITRTRAYPKVDIITGRGKHSVNMKSLLRPAVEKVLRERKLKYSVDNDGGRLSVALR